MPNALPVRTPDISISIYGPDRAEVAELLLDRAADLGRQAASRRKGSGIGIQLQTNADRLRKLANEILG